MELWLDKHGNAIDAATANELLGNFEYKCVGRTKVTSASDAAVDFLISTVWLGLNHQYGDGPPLLFETMVFAEAGGWADQYVERYGTLAEAEAGHAETVALVAATVPDEVVTAVDAVPAENRRDVLDRIDEVLSDTTVSMDAMRSRPCS